MTTPWSERRIGRVLARGTFKTALCVLPNYTMMGGEIDMLVVTANRRCVDVEIKINRSDLRADAKKDKWWHRYPAVWDAEGRTYARAEPTRREWPRGAWKHYYALPESIWREDWLSDCAAISGVLLITESEGIKCRRPAKPNPQAERLTPEACIGIARLASLRMWDAYRESDELQEKLIAVTTKALRAEMGR